jgi:fructose-1,6-bisphosphatase/inositol monophosphatase family enzyme
MENYLKLAQEIAHGSAEIALKYFGFETEKTWKSDNTPLTQADTEINSFVIQKIQEAYPDHSIQGEEESLKKAGSQYIWVCDPIDGTMPYSLGLPTFTFSLALVDERDGQPILGLVNDPIMKNMYWAYKGGGAFRNGKKIQVTTDTELKNTYIELDGSRNMGYSKTGIMEKLRVQGAKVMSLLSVVYGGVQVANGKFSGVVFINKYAHDVAALKIIIEEAGGKVTDLEGNARRYDAEGVGCVASNGILHQKILECVK